MRLTDADPALAGAWVRGKGKVQHLVEVADRFGLIRALRPLHDRRRTSLTVLAYHRVVPAGSPESYPVDLELISATPEQLDWQMEYIRRHMNPVSLAQLTAHLEGGPPLPPAAVAVTFDDGFIDTYRYAFPILRRHSIPATVFVATGYVDSGEPFWFELAADLTLQVEPGALRIEECAEAFPAGHAMHERRGSLRRLHQVLKKLPNARRTEVISGWARRFAVRTDTAATELSRPISWAQVTEMAAAGIDFGSHTVTHPNLTQLADPDLEWELCESKRVLEDRLGRRVDTLAYPIGTPSAYDTRVVAAAKHAGFRLALSYVSGTNWLKKLDRFELRRHGVGPGTTSPYFRALTTLPAWIG
ncbi:MAG: polysaccharide deacetylase family protein [Steroidobacteraceae bacterium]